MMTAGDPHDEAIAGFPGSFKFVLNYKQSPIIGMRDDYDIMTSPTVVSVSLCLSLTCFTLMLDDA